jgi:hypothetical protein
LISVDLIESDGYAGFMISHVMYRYQSIG